MKNYLLIGLSLALSVVYALFNREKAAKYKDKAKVAQMASKAMKEANKAIREADLKGRDKLESKDPDRNHFT